MSPRADGLSARGLSVAIGGRLIVDGVDIDIVPGTVTALIGPNGAGKSTLIRALAGVLAPSAGTVTYDERDWFTMPRRDRARLVALVEQDASTDVALRVNEVVALGRTPHTSLAGSDPHPTAATDALEAAGVTPLADRFFSTLSGGERQRVQLARALAQEPRILLLDEPTNHLDVSAQLDVLALLRALAKKQLGVLTALHDLNLAASYADTVVMIANGRVVAAGPPVEVLTAEAIGAVYGVDATILTHPTTGAPLIASASRSTEPTAD